MPGDRLLRQGEVAASCHANAGVTAEAPQHSLSHTNAAHSSCILYTAMDLFRWNKLAKLRAEGIKVRHGKVLGNGNDKSFFQLTFN